MTTSQFEFIKRIGNYFSSVYHFSDDVSIFIGCLFALESYYGQNELSRSYNNVSSMKTPYVRISNCLNFADDKSIWAHYENLFDCYDDFALWLQFQKPMRKQLEDVTLFPAVLRTYCPEKDYISKINRIYSQFKSYKNV